MSLPLQLGGEGAGETLAFDGGFLQVVSTLPFAPGASVSLRVEFPTGYARLTGKSRSSKKRADGRFDVSFRLVTLRREVREALLAHHAG